MLVDGVWRPSAAAAAPSWTDGGGLAARLLASDAVARTGWSIGAVAALALQSTFSGDTRPDQLGGEGFLGEWFAI
jgi:hypothetical protein